MADGRKVFSDSVTPLPAVDGVTPHGLMVAAAKPENNKETMKVVFSLAIPADAQARLQQMVADGKVASPKDIAKNFSADPADAKALASWLKSEGFQVDKISADRTSLYAHGTVDQIQKSLNVNMVRVTKDGITYTAAQNAPSLPADVGKSVSAIVGLQPFRRAHKQFRICTPQSGVTAPLRHTKRPAAKKTTKAGGKAKKGNAAASAATASVQDGYLVSEILKAYNANGLSVTGKGQTIAILIDTFPATADLTAFWKLNGLKTTIKQIEMINVNGVSMPPQEGEETLDAQWTSGIAPGAKIRIYASGTLSFADLDSALDRIITDLATEPGMRQLSISLGLGETFMAPDEIKAQSQKFLRLAASGVNVFVASGDAGSNPDVTGHSSGGPTQVEYEASDINVIAVGGTTLNLAPDGSVDSESGWVGSGGGRSGLFNRQPWQTGTGRAFRHRTPGAGRQPRRRSEYRSLRDPAWRPAADRRNELEYAGVGRVLRPDQRSAGQRQQAGAHLPASADLQIVGQRQFPRCHRWQQRRVQCRPRLRHGDRPRRAQREAAGDDARITQRLSGIESIAARREPGSCRRPLPA